MVDGAEVYGCVPHGELCVFQGLLLGLSKYAAPVPDAGEAELVGCDVGLMNGGSCWTGGGGGGGGCGGGGKADDDMLLLYVVELWYCWYGC